MKKGGPRPPARGGTRPPAHTLGLSLRMVAAHFFPGVRSYEVTLILRYSCPNCETRIYSASIPVNRKGSVQGKDIEAFRGRRSGFASGMQFGVRVEIALLGVEDHRKSGARCRG